MGLSEWADLGQGGRIWGLAAVLELQDLSEGRARETVSLKPNGLGRQGWSLTLCQSPLENQEKSLAVFMKYPCLLHSVTTLLF